MSDRRATPRSFESATHRDCDHPVSAVETIKLVLEKRLLPPQLTIIPTRGATEDEIHEEEQALNSRFYADHIALLRKWNGITLDIIRLFGCGKNSGEVGRLSSMQIDANLGLSDAIVIGSDAAGFIYVQAEEGRIFSFDTDGRTCGAIAKSLDDMIDRVVFGPDAASFGGDRWLAELHRVGIMTQ